jgi:hypothetical protein
MPNIRQIKTCNRCRLLKLRCDRIKPSCERCIQAEACCSFLLELLSEPASKADSLVAESNTTNRTSSRSSSNQSSPPSEESAPPPNTIVAQKDSKAVKRRQRAHLSCTRCHRLKVRCDKELPCSRCRRSGWGKQCTYTHRVEKDPSASDAGPGIAFVAAHEDPRNIVTTWHTRRRGATHWKALVSRVRDPNIVINKRRSANRG